MYDVRDKHALITGGTRGIGLEIARHLLKRGASVSVNGRSVTPEAEALQQEFGDDRVRIEVGDISDPVVCSELTTRAANEMGRLDIIIHSAGGPEPGKMTDLTTEDWMSAFDTHVHPVFHLFRAGYPFLKRSGGVVLLISSVAGIRGCPNTVAYQTVKGALIPMTKALALDHGKEGIRVNCLAPGIIRTRFHDQMSEEAYNHNITNRIPIGREGQVENVADAAMSMITNDFVTGEVFVVDGGMSMRVTN